ncbi:MAG: hypothetical protein AAFQ71_15790 [Planctomycetota bacterium]|mgnify:FL=1
MSNGTTNGNGNGNGRVRWAGVALTAGLAIAALIVQWGVVTTKLDQVEKRLDEFIAEASQLRSEYRVMERRVAFLEGRESVSSHPERTDP